LQATAGFHYPISKIISPVSQFIYYDSIAFDAINGVFDPDAQAGNLAVAFFILRAVIFVNQIVITSAHLQKNGGAD
jgi:hypothetical protein